MFLSFYKVISHAEPERGFEPGSAAYKATALPFELPSIDWRGGGLSNKKA